MGAYCISFMVKNKRLFKIREALSHRSSTLPMTDVWSIFQDMANGESIPEDIILCEFVPVRLIAMLEDNLRGIYSAIIDNSRFRKNLPKLVDLKNLDIDVLSSFQDDDVTIGEYFSYSVSCNKFEDIDKALSVLLDIDFKNKLSEFLGEETESVIKTIQKVFVARHRLCHESSILIISKEEVETYVSGTIRFMNAIDEITQVILFPEIIETTHDMVEEARRDFEKEEKTLEALIADIEGSYDEFPVGLKFPVEFVEEWKKYREERAKIEWKDVEGGCYYPVHYYSSMTQTTKWLIKELKFEYKHLLRSHAWKAI